MGPLEVCKRSPLGLIMGCLTFQLIHCIYLGPLLSDFFMGEEHALFFFISPSSSYAPLCTW